MTQSISDLFERSLSNHSLVRPRDPTWSRGPVLSGREPRFFPGRVVTPWLAVRGVTSETSPAVPEGVLTGEGSVLAWIRACFDPMGPGGPLGDWFVFCRCSSTGGWFAGRSVLVHHTFSGAVTSSFLHRGKVDRSNWWSKLSSMDSSAAVDDAYGRGVLHDGSVEAFLPPPSG